MRGTPLKTFYDGRETRIIPAYAGNTSSAMLNSFSFRDHPRVCGEHQCPRGHISTSWGSSPRMRGTRGLAVYPIRPGRIIPAYAGNTGSAGRSGARTWDHPRVCGEHTARMMTTTGRAGSSPRMRGTPVLHESRTLRGGIIPAYAGNTVYSSCQSLLSRDHPRVCGEHFDEHLAVRITKGSSPRMRGTPANDKRAE